MAFPQQIDPWQYAREHGILSAQLAYEALPRLHDQIHTMPRALEVSLTFGLDQGTGLVQVDGHLQGEITLECQRTLGTLAWPFDHSFSLLLATEAQSRRLNDEQEAFLFDGLSISPIELVEDELLLLLPLVPKKPLKDCEADANWAYYDPSRPTELAAEEKSNPFAVLSSLKKNT